ncbi:MAG TPA: hypothetical protein VF649_06900 [Sphingomonas sp.]|jgi:gamma-glutamyl phosphate reductase|uniref:hypothetical protein n=1 Tax=Sphingomonas sp. TaxID=28214 RepID=UPI002ED92A7A
MSFWQDALRALQQAALLQHKVDQALQVAEDARRQSIDTRERLIQLETTLDIIISRSGARRPRLPDA